MKTKMNGTYVPLIIIGFVYAYILADSLFEDKYIKDNGIEISVKVTVCQLEHIRSGKRHGKQWLSSGYYYVNGKKNKCSIERIIPLGTEFKIRYDPRKPERFRLVNPREFDNYPREMEEK
jgi:hypothetical protein